MLNIKKFTFNPFAENTYIVSNDQQECLIIDPGCSNAYEEDQLFSYIEKMKLNPIRLLNTHCHIDHVFGNDAVKTKYGLKLEAHSYEVEVLERVHLYAPMFGMDIQPQSAPDSFLVANQYLQFGNTAIKILFTPGHSPGSICFYFENEKIVISGDVLFKGSIGRHDLPGSNKDDLFKSLTTVMMALPDDVIVYSGHGPETSIKEEKASNPFLDEKFFFAI